MPLTQVWPVVFLTMELGHYRVCYCILRQVFREVNDYLGC